MAEKCRSCRKMERELNRHNDARVSAMIQAQTWDAELGRVKADREFVEKSLKAQLEKAEKSSKFWKYGCIAGLVLLTIDAFFSWFLYRGYIG